MKQGWMLLAVVALAACTSTAPTTGVHTEASSSGAGIASVQYRLLAIPSSTAKNYARNIVYRYAITAPSTQDAVIDSQSFALIGGRWGRPELGIFSDASYKHRIDMWTSEDNYGNHDETLNDLTTLKGSLIIPKSQIRYLQLIVGVGTPASPDSLHVKHPSLPEITLDIQ